ncbi:MAG: hypothetical protein GXP08_00295 [Gammaproteobacteria bacterium]|nr:hypothetical protein [Gammaproteobacteria bacterium]
MSIKETNRKSNNPYVHRVDTPEVTTSHCNNNVDQDINNGNNKNGNDKKSVFEPKHLALGEQGKHLPLS